MTGDPMTAGVMVLIGLLVAPLGLLVIGFAVMVVAAHLRNWRNRQRGPELIEPSWRVVEARDRRVVVDGDDPVACAEDDRRAVAALLEADREVVAAMRRAKTGPRVIAHGNAPEGADDAVTVVETVPDPRDPAARAEAEAMRRQFGMPARRDRRGR